MRQRHAALIRTATLCAAAAMPALAADGLDTSWNGTGTVMMSVPGHNLGNSSYIGAVATLVQPDGRIVLAGKCTAADKVTICMARLQPNGLRDYSFGPGETGAFAFSEFPDYPVSTIYHGLIRQNDGRVVVSGVGAGAVPSDTTLYATATRLLANGTLDPAVPVQPVRFEFSHNATEAMSFITATALQADGKLVVVGYTNRAGADPSNLDFAVARLRADLTLDPTFNGTGIRVAAFDLGGNNADYPAALAIQPDGKIVVAGYAMTGANGFEGAVLRLNADGTPDASFGNVGRVSFDFGNHGRDDMLTAVKVDGAGRIWLGGVYQWAGNDHDFLVGRLLANGALDPGFCFGTGYTTVAFDLDQTTTRQMDDQAMNLLLQSDGGIVLTGSASNGAADGKGYDFAAARLMPACSLDTTFGTNGKLHGRFANTATYNVATDSAFGGSGIVLAGAAASTYDPVNYNTTDGQFGAAMIRLDLIFTDGFER